MRRILGYLSSIMNGGLDYTAQKTVRAKGHLEALQGEIRMFLSSEPITRTEEDDIENGVHIFRFELRDFSVEIPLLVGEIAYNLRSGLDHLAWQLSLLSGRTPSRDTAFPIQNDRSKRSEDRFRRTTWDIPCEAIEIIKSLQPYARGEDFKSHPLWQLNKLCNVDKHTTIPISCTELTFDSGTPDVEAEFFRKEINQGVEVIVPLEVKDKVYFNPRKPKLILGFPIDKPGTPFELTGGITGIYEFVRDEVIPRFERFFL